MGAGGRSAGLPRGAPLDVDTATEWLDADRAAASTSADLYRWACTSGVSRELARITLPVSTYTRWVSSWDAHNLFVMGANVFPHNGAYQPTGLVGALAYRTADIIKSRYIKNPGPLVSA